MTTYIVLLRGINVNGQKLIKMTELLLALQELNLENVKTYIQSGNAVFSTESKNARELEKQIKDKIQERFGFNVPVMVKEKAEWRQAIQNNPFGQEAQADNKKVLIHFLSEAPEQTRLAEINPEQYTPDTFTVIGNVIYLFCPNGYGQTKLHNIFFEKKLKLLATTRNWNTVQALMTLADTISEQ
jgi:uncharacterized protein (DUF1697 family)